MKKIIEIVLKVVVGFLLFLLGVCASAIIIIPISFFVEKTVYIFLLIIIGGVLRISWCIGSVLVEIIKRAKGGLK